MQKPVASQFPHGVGCPPPPGMDPRKGKGKLMCIKVRMLDDSVGVFHLGHKATGQALFDEVCRHLNLLESDYFGLEFIDSYGNRCWLDKEKSILRQIMVAQSDARFFFIVKFYTPNPAELEEEYTWYLFALQIRRDLARGELICSNESTVALLVALIIQSECGDFSPLDYPDASAYLGGTQFVPRQTPAFAQAVMEQHKRLVGMGPAESDFALLETARRCDFYGIRLHPARDIEGTDVALAVAHMGIKVFHQLNCVTTFSWAKVRKLSFKRKRLMIKVYPDSCQFYKETIEFGFENRDDCKNFWKKCVEHHSFFRCAEPMGTLRGGDQRPLKSGGDRRYLFARGSHFHYQGRTQKQLIDYVREHRKRREPFQRPLRRGNGFFVDFAPGAIIATNSLGHHQQQQQRAHFLVSDWMASEPIAHIAGARMDNEAKSQFLCQQQQHQRMPNNNNNNNYVCTFPSLCSAQQQQPNGGIEGGGGARKGRPKSAVLVSDKNASSRQNAGMGDHHQQLAMHSSYHADTVVRTTQQQNGGGRKTAEMATANSADVSALLHQHLDPMSMSMPNVLADGVAHQSSETSSTVAADPFFYTSAHKKSVSGENFHRAAELRDNQSEGSYHLGRGSRNVAHQHGHGHQQSDSSAASSLSEIGTPASPVDPRVYQTTFTTKRVGNIIVKRVTGATAPDANSGAKHQLPQQPIRPPLTSRSAVEGEAAGDEADSVTSSSAACSDYSLAATAPPGSCSSTGASTSSLFSRNNSAVVGGGRIRCVPTNQSGFLPANLRNEIPVAIDGPPSSRQSTMTAKTTIIRPVLIPSPASLEKDRSTTGGKRPSTSSTSTQSTIISQAQRRPLVIQTPDIDSRTKQVQDGQKMNTNNNNSREGQSAEGVQQQQQMAGSTGPVAGRIVRREDLVITTAGIGLLQQSGGQKPKVPPKPDLASLDIQPAKAQQEEPLLDPLESILKDVRAMNEVLDELESPSSPSTASKGTFPTGAGQQHSRPPPTAIAIESEECPDVRTVHLFNGDKVPYRLTVRNLTTATKGGGDNGATGDHSTEAASVGGGKKRVVVGDTGRHKSIELVQRRRLPSQDSYSSQDHSISPTTPDSGNVLEYYLRKRSASSDRAGALAATPSVAGDRRGAKRRQTQPVELGALKSSGGGGDKDARATSGEQQVAATEGVAATTPGIAATEGVSTTERVAAITPAGVAESQKDDSAKIGNEEPPQQGLLETDF